MTRVDLHPEELFDRARRGLASASELVRFESHLEHCATCRFEFDLARDADWDARPEPEDALRNARVRKRALAAFSNPALRRVRPRRSKAVIALIAAALFSGAGALAAVVVHGVTHRAAPTTPAPALHSAAPRATRPAAPVAPVAPSAEPEPAPSSLPASAARRTSHIVATAATRNALPTTEGSETAAALFSQANQARRGGDARRAARLYQDLERRFPGSPEEVVSRVTLGRLLLDRLGDASGALSHFNAYLGNPSGGELEQEALIGRALALGRLGRASEERAAWTALLRAYPHSAYADRARARLQSLP